MTTSPTPPPKEAKNVTFLTDDEGNPSSIRVAMTVAFVISILLTVCLVFGWTKNPALVKELILYFLIAAFGGKSAQKFAEAIKAAKS